ncbi:HET-domain-containing protein [Patellaria atrata CBS 101060]|uniref:HET-domain-containing protein n=1 Tax=Patellaria atrata CBS 101060 TaxID=1346257 RepID=A0A9P4S2E0_9PEZI|nr:HET-domain-containing protein [Patellaria atrata CBS 101060]
MATKPSPRSELFEYEELPKDDDTIRVVTITAGWPWQSIACNLTHVSLSNRAARYNALSYTWGDPRDSCSIKCNGKVFVVTKDLHSALRHLRQRSKPVALWIDQICINQSDNMEKGHQIQLMSRIYSSAALVIVWLGPHSDNSKDAFRFGKKVVSTFLPDAPSVGADRQLPTDHHLLRGTGELFRSDHHWAYGEGRILPDRYHKNWEALKTLLSRRYFSRVWIIQEVAMASNIIVYCGHDRFTWAELVLLVDLLYTNIPPMFFGIHTEILGLPANHMRAIQKVKMTRADNITPSLYDLLIRHKDFESTDPRDKVYALYGLAGISIAPDYSMPAEEYFTRLMVQMILEFTGKDCTLPENEPTFRNLIYARNFAAGLPVSVRGRIMSLLFSAGISKQKLNLPSWVPDWSVSQTPFPIWGRTHDGRSPSCAGGDSLGPMELLGLEWTQQGDIHIVSGFSEPPGLRLTGKICGTVTKVGSTEVRVDEPMESENQQRALATWFTESIHISTSIAPSVPAPDNVHINPGRDEFVNTIRMRNQKPLLATSEFYHGKTYYDNNRVLNFTKDQSYKSKLPFVLYTSDYWESIPRIAGRSFFAATRGCLGLAPFGTHVDDVLAIFIGFDVPFILRPDGDDRYRLVGDCYVNSEEIWVGDAVGVYDRPLLKQRLVYRDLPIQTITLI